MKMKVMHMHRNIQSDSMISFLCIVLQLIRFSQASSSKEYLDVRHTVEDGFEHPNAHWEGFVLTDVFLHHTTRTPLEEAPEQITHTLTQRKLRSFQYE